MKLLACILIGIAASAGQARPNEARSEQRDEARTQRIAGKRARTSQHPAGYCETCARDANGRIKRSPAATREFRQSHPCPATERGTGACPGYVIDHVVPLKRGGLDAPSNMQWQTAAEAKAKDRIE